jgi:aromatic ring-opening dioxygenase catalytic subunit (LigB family)
VIYFGHGNPMNAILDNACTKAWRSIGASIPTPRAILCVSAHWYVSDTRVTSMERPRTIHDFGGFLASSTRSSIRPRATLSSPRGLRSCDPR